MQDNFSIARNSCFPELYSNANGEFWLKIENFFGVGTGRRKECKAEGLTGAEKRACVKQLKASGWEKGQPIPAEMSGVTAKDVVEAEKYPAVETYVSTYVPNKYTPIEKDTDLGHYTSYPQPPAYPRPPSESKGGLSGWAAMSQNEKMVTVVGISFATLVFGLLIGRMTKRPQVIGISTI